MQDAPVSLLEMNFNLQYFDFIINKIGLGTTNQSDEFRLQDCIVTL